MPKKRKSDRAEVLSRKLEIVSFAVSVSLRAVHHRGEDPRIESGPWLELRGIMTEPVRDVRGIKVSLFPQDDAQRAGATRPASVGSVIQDRPELDVVLIWPPDDFDRAWALALAGR